MAEEVQRELNTEVQAHSEAIAKPKALGFDATMLVGLAMAVLLTVFLVKKVPAAIGKALDAKIAGIRAQLDEAAALRAEAEQLKTEYEARAASAASDAAATLERARAEADAIRAKAETDAAALVERRTRRAEDKIAAEERTALQQLRSTAADAAARAAARIIAERHDAGSDKALVDQAILGIR